MPAITFYKHEPIPMEMHKVKIVQQLQLLPTAQRLQKMQQAGFNTFQLHNGDIFLDMLTDSGVNAMSDLQQSAMLRADDAYAGSETFFRMRDKLEELFGMPFCLPAHQGRACENILATRFVKPGSCVIMNYHFTTAKAHITRLGGRVEELVRAEGLVSKSSLPFKGNIDLTPWRHAFSGKHRQTSPLCVWRPVPTSSAANPYPLPIYRPPRPSAAATVS